ncbi:MAG TPA: inositol monophosphatase family protein, partial [Candidatus Caenarcaniphilales bacterium]
MNNLSAVQEQQIRQIIRQAGHQAQQMANRQFQVSQKGPDDFVTSVDQTLDRKLAKQFASWFPADGIITEENAQSTEAFHAGYARLWLIDPLDGTDDFIHGQLAYAVMVGLLQDCQPVAGWVYEPAQ